MVGIHTGDQDLAGFVRRAPTPDFAGGVLAALLLRPSRTLRAKVDAFVRANGLERGYVAIHRAGKG